MLPFIISSEFLKTLDKNLELEHALHSCRKTQWEHEATGHTASSQGVDSFVVFFEKGSHSVVLAGLKHTM